MAKKNKRPASPNEQSPAAPQLPVRFISKRGWKAVGGGIALLLIGYFVLSMTDPMGQNWASNLSPFLILGGYALIGLGIVLKDPATPPV